MFRVYITGFERVWFGEFSQPTEEHVILQFNLKRELADVIFSPNRDDIIKSVFGSTEEKASRFCGSQRFQVAIN